MASMRWLGGVAVIVALAAGEAADAQQIGEKGAASVYGPLRSDVLATPTDAEVMAAWPAGKPAQGSAVAHCKGTASGELAGCALTLERGAGAGQALLSLAPRFRLKLPADAHYDDVIISATWPAPDAIGDWQVKPKPGDFMTTATDAAWRAGGEAFVVMNCLEGKLGTLYQCAVVYQDPPGKGFGTMLLRFPAYLKLKPALLGGKPVTSGVNFAFHMSKAAPNAVY